MTMLKDQPLNSQAIRFLEKAFCELERQHFFLEQHWHIDHLCFRTSTLENYLSAKRQFEKISKLLIESEVNGRLISTYKLDTPLLFNEWKIDLIEVPAPKKGRAILDGFEHFEVVCDLPFEDIKKKYHKFNFNESGLAKNFNQELEVIFDGFAIKFHQLSLESVINIESNKTIFSALKETNILSYLKSFNPLVAGTFPLNISREGSDIDILISDKDFEVMKSVILEKFSTHLNFNYREILVQGEPTLFVSFICQGVEFEIFGQNTSSVRQRGYLHFLIEERLLKIGGDSFVEKIKKARMRGLKTEPAFAEVLGFRGDPYQELLALQKMNNNDLKKLIETSSVSGGLR